MLQNQPSKSEISDKGLTRLLERCAVDISSSPDNSADTSAIQLIKLAERCMAEQKHLAAIELYDEAIRLDNLSEQAFAGVARAHLALKNYSVSLRYLNQAASLRSIFNSTDQGTPYETAIASLNKRIAKPSDRTSEPIRPKDKWYSGRAIKCPISKSEVNGERFGEFYLGGLVPPSPMITKAQNIATMGSCFATNVARYLHTKGYIASRTNNKEFQYDNLYIDDDFFNTYVLREAFEVAFEADFDSPNWVDANDCRAKDDQCRAVLFNRDHIKTLLGTADVYIITLGLAEIWYDKLDGVVYPSGLNIDEFDENRHGFRLSTVEENQNNLERIYGLIRANRPEATVVFTLSPVPMSATFRPINCIAANSVSKAVLRLAIDCLWQRHHGDDRLFYFPSYEIVKEYFIDPYADDGRHVKDDVVNFIMDQFSNSFLID